MKKRYKQYITVVKRSGATELVDRAKVDPSSFKISSTGTVSLKLASGRRVIGRVA